MSDDFNVAKFKLLLWPKFIPKKDDLGLSW
jgi:hypothetical protein